MKPEVDELCAGRSGLLLVLQLNDKVKVCSESLAALGPQQKNPVLLIGFDVMVECKRYILVVCKHHWFKKNTKKTLCPHREICNDSIHRKCTHSC